MDAAGKYKIAADVNNVRVEHVVSKTVLEHAVAVGRRAPPNQAPAPVDFKVDVSDYTLAATLLLNYIYKSKDGAVASMNSKAMGSLLVMEAAVAAGWCQPPVVFDAATADGVWRRHAASAVAFLESVLEQEQMTVAAVAAVDTKMKLLACLIAIKQITLTHALSSTQQRKQLAELAG